MVDIGFGAVVFITGLFLLAVLAWWPLRILVWAFKSRGVYALVPVMLARRKLAQETEFTWHFCEEAMKRMIEHDPRYADAVLDHMTFFLECVNKEQAAKKNEPEA